MSTATVTKDPTQSLAEAMSKMADAVKGNTLTPESIAAAVKAGSVPYEDPQKKLREKREKMNLRASLQAGDRVKIAKQKTCPHTDAVGRSSINTVHNFSDNRARGTCMICGVWITPQMIEIGPPTMDMDGQGNPVSLPGEPRVVPAHPLYHLVEAKELADYNQYSR